jgi:hypothetical protein
MLLDCVCQQVDVALKCSVQVSVVKLALSIEAFLIFLCPSQEIVGQHLDYVITDYLQFFLTFNH